jgi:hypothetical protein
MRKLCVLLWMMTLSTLALAAGPNFTGAWLRVAASSDPTPNQMYWATRETTEGRGGGGQRNPEIILSVNQDGSMMHVAESANVVRDYVLDGKPHTRSTDTGIQKAAVTAHVEGDEIVIETTQPFGGMPGNATLAVKSVWALSSDGKTLTITTTRELPARKQTYKTVYTKTEAQPGAICSAGCVVPK